MKTATEELRRIAAAHDGLLRPDDVVAEAQPADSPLHKYFEWEDTEAARLYRLQQAAQLIRVSVIVVDSTPPRTTRCFVSLTPDRGPEGGYREVLAVLSDPEYRAQLLTDAHRDLQAFQRKYAGLQELETLLGAMRNVTERQETAVA